MRRHTAIPVSSIILLSVVLGAPLPGLAAGQYQFQDSKPARSLRPGEVSSPVHVQAKLNLWQNSGVWLEAGGRYLITAQGQWQVAPTCPPTGPDGVGLYNLLCWDIGGKTVDSVSHSTLIGRIGRDTAPFPVGANLEFMPANSGVLNFIINDHPDYFTDNIGTVSVKIRRLGGAPANSAPPRTESGQIVIPEETPKNTKPVKIRRGGGGGSGGGGTGTAVQ